VKFAPEDRAFLAALLAPLPCQVLRRLRLLVRPDTVLRWHHNLVKQRHARICRPKRPGRPHTVRSIRALVLRLARENRNLVMDLEDVGAHAAYLIRDRDAKYPALIDEILADVGIQSVFTGVRMPRMNSIMERWVLSLRRELLDRTLIWNAHHLRHALSEYERFYNEHRTHRSLQAAAPLRALPETITDPREIARLDIRRHDRPGGVIHEYQHAA
jgi:transposase InsO family protein